MRRTDSQAGNTQDKRLQSQTRYTFVENEYGDVVSTDFYLSEDDKAGRDLIDWNSESKRLRFFIAYPNNFDVVNELLIAQRCLVTYGYWHAGEPPGQWTEIATIKDDWLGAHMVPEANWQGTCRLDELVGKEHLIEFYSLGIVDGKRGKNRWRLRKLWQCPVRVLARVETPLMSSVKEHLWMQEFDANYASALATSTPDPKPLGQG